MMNLKVAALLACAFAMASVCHADANTLEQAIEACKAGESWQSAVSGCTQWLDSLKASGAEPARLEKPYILRSEVLIELKRFDEAVQDLTALLEIAPTNAAAFHWRGLALARQNLHSQAIDDLSKAIEVNPKAYGTYTQRGVARLGAGDPAGAIQDFTQSLAITKTQVAYVDRALTFMFLDNCLLARRDLSKVVHANGENLTAFFYRAECEIKLSMFKLALRDFGEVIELRGESAEASFERGRLRTFIGDYSEAKDDYARVLALLPTNARAATFANRGLVEVKMGQLDAARQDLNEAIEASPANLAAHYQRAIVHFLKGDLEDANSDIDTVIAGYPDAAEALYLRGKIREKLGHETGTNEDLAQAFGKNPALMRRPSIEELSRARIAIAPPNQPLSAQPQPIPTNAMKQDETSAMCSPHSPIEPSMFAERDIAEFKFGGCRVSIADLIAEILFYEERQKYPDLGPGHIE
jgi:tetratricopeptide (TPR) repeat protein